MTDELDEGRDDAAVDGLSRLLGALAREDVAGADAGAWSRRSLAAARPLLAAHARREYRRRVAAAMAAALVPLPLIALYDRVLLGWLYGLAESLLPAPLPALAVGSYAAATSLLLALTYAAIPVLVDRTQPWRIAR